MNLDFNYYIAVFLRRIQYFIFVASLVGAAAIAAAVLLPPTYWAQAILLVEPAQIPGQLAPPTVQSAALEQLQVMQSKLMTRANLLQIAKDQKAIRNIEGMSPDDIVDAMRSQTSITNKAGKEQATVMTIGFSGPSAKATAEVVNQYVTLVLKDSVATRTEATRDTLGFFDQDVKTLGLQLDALTTKILAFKEENKDALPDTLSFRLTQQTSLQDRISTEERNISSLKEERARLIAIFNSTGQIDAANSAAAQTPEAKQLAALQAQLQQALAIYSEDNPKIKMLRAQIAQQENIVKAQVPATPGTGATAPAGSPASMLDVQIASIDARIAQSGTTRDQLQEQLDAITDTIDRTPANQIALDGLNRDLMNIQSQYNTAVAKQSQAAAADRIESMSKGEKVAVIEGATVPDRPIKPKRLLIAVGGVFGGILLGLGTIVLIELMNRSVRRPKDLVKAFGITPIATVPYMRTPHEAVARRSMFLALLGLAVIGIPALIYAVHIYYLPLDVLLSRAAGKIGIRM
jgi:uncharacterized protein involved in exopolysaccharide biosynthesis